MKTVIIGFFIVAVIIYSVLNPANRLTYSTSTPNVVREKPLSEMNCQEYSYFVNNLYIRHGWEIPASMKAHKTELCT